MRAGWRSHVTPSPSSRQQSTGESDVGSGRKESYSQLSERLFFGLVSRRAGFTGREHRQKIPGLHPGDLRGDDREPVGERE